MLRVTSMFCGAFDGRKVLVTGDTGFKGSWLCHWLLNLGADVAGLGLPPESEPNLFTILHLGSHLRHTTVDVRDFESLRRYIAHEKPEIVFHLAAQPLVRRSYEQSKLTFDTNVGGTVNLLQALREVPSARACVIVTSDKCYENREWAWGYRENDSLGGHDPYSASKAAAEIVVGSYRKSFFADPDGMRLASARAGNVIGGGDWARDRIVTDFVTSVADGKPVRIRNPHAARPWQHVLEPLSGYLLLATRLLADEGTDFAGAWNFGPADDHHATVEELASTLIAEWGQGALQVAHHSDQPHEAHLLKLDCSKARTRLGWRAVWDLNDAVRHTVLWYRAYYGADDVHFITDMQLQQYQAEARRLSLNWTMPGESKTRREAA